MKQDKHVTLTLDAQTDLTLPVYTATYGPQVIDVSSLVKQGYFTYDPGFVSTAACESKITYIDGEKGVLLYRGYPIAELTDNADFVSTSYLLLNGELPTTDEKQGFQASLNEHLMPPLVIQQSLQGFDKGAHPMGMLISLLGALASYYHPIKLKEAPVREQVTHQLVGMMPALVAFSFQRHLGEAVIAPRADLSYAANFLYMLFGEEKAQNPVLCQAMDRILILHADHEQNASTSTVRLAGSTLANPYACMAAGVAALWGPAHGGANEAVIKMLGDIGDAKHIPDYIARAKDSDDPFRLMGFGHRVYKNYDPRAKVMKATCDAVLAELGEPDDPLFKIALQLEKIALEDEYFIERKLYPNVDFYSGIILRAMGIPTALYTPIFALARTVGWLAHWHEMLSQSGLKIGRPRQLYTGPAQRDI